MEEYEINCYQKCDWNYPQRMLSLANMPGKLYVKGNLPREDRPTVAIVGSRMCSSYGKNIAREFAAYYSRQGIQVISGLALGIDGQAHEGALRGGTPTFAVLACGTDVCYPKTNSRLYTQILNTGGGIISEQKNGTPAMPRLFPARNRIISALTDIVIVVEARLRSGSLITADFAMEQGKTVFAVPGRVGDTLSEGCNRLISQGAGILWSPEIILEELTGNYYSYKGIKELPDFSPEEKSLLNLLDTAPIHIQDLEGKYKGDFMELMQVLSTLEMKGYITQIGKNYYVKAVKI